METFGRGCLYNLGCLGVLFIIAIIAGGTIFIPWIIFIPGIILLFICAHMVTKNKRISQNNHPLHERDQESKHE
jgi:fatty acid desaturase